MYPSKSMVDYMTEMNRLFPQRPENDLLQTNTYGMPSQSPFSSTINRSSSSADSTSPDSFPEITTFRPELTTRRLSDNSDMPKMYEHTQSYEYQRPLYETPKMSKAPFMLRRQRPIVGRKILSAEAKPTERVQVPPKIPEEYEFLNSLWQEEPVLLQQTPPNMNRFFVEQKDYTQNIFYELFPPVENRGFEFRTPVKSSPPISNMSNISPTMSNASPNSINCSPTAPVVPHLISRSASVGPNIGPSSSRYHHQEVGQSKMCTFCRKNGETPIVYMTHSVKERIGNKYVVSCPILRLHICSTCGATGDNAHTITYCPVLRSNNNGQPLQSTTITLKNTRIKSNGRRRF